MLLTAVVFIIILSVLVLVHEFGHFMVAKGLKIKVEEFGFGLPPRALGFKKGETVYSLNWIPLGGFVRIFGEEGEARDNPRSFAHKKTEAVVLVDRCSGRNGIMQKDRLLGPQPAFNILRRFYRRQTASKA